MDNLSVSPCGQVHHDLRNGLLVILGYVARLEGGLGPKHQGDLAGIKQQVTRMEGALAGCQSLPEGRQFWRLAAEPDLCQGCGSCERHISGLADEQEIIYSRYHYQRDQALIEAAITACRHGALTLEVLK